MKLTDMQENKFYIVTSYGNLSDEEITELNQIGFILGEEISIGTKVNCIKQVCMFNIENTVYSINSKYIEEIRIEEI